MTIEKQAIGSREDVLDALEQICSSEYFSEAEQIRKFLCYVVRETLEGRADRIKAYSVAIEALGKSPDFDPSQDPIVRITANRLRSALAKYYNETGNNHKVVIRLPRGHYIPVFEFPETQEDAAIGKPFVPRPKRARLGNWRWRLGFPLWAIAIAVLALIAIPASAFLLWSNFFADSEAESGLGRVWIVVQPVEAEPGSSGDLGAAIGGHLIAQLTRYDGVTVVDAERASLIPSVTGSLLPAAAWSDHYVFSLAANIRLDEAMASVRWYLTDMRTHQVMWASDRIVSVGGNAATEIVQAITGELLGLEGAIPIILDRDHQADFESDYACLAGAQRQIYTEDTLLLDNFATCLERVVRNYSTNGQAWALLSLAYHRQGHFAASFGRDPTPFHVKQQQAAMRAGALSPETFFPRLARLAMAYDTGQRAAFDSLANWMLDRYGGDPQLKLMIGKAFVSIGRSDRGLPLIEAGLQQIPSMASAGHLMLALDRYVSDNLEAALRYLDEQALPADYRYWLVRTVVLSRAGRQEEAEQAWNSVLLLRPDYGTSVCSDLTHANIDPDYYSRIVDDLARIVDSLPGDCQAGPG